MGTLQIIVYLLGLALLIGFVLNAFSSQESFSFRVIKTRFFVIIDNAYNRINTFKGAKLRFKLPLFKLVLLKSFFQKQGSTDDNGVTWKPESADLAHSEATFKADFEPDFSLDDESNDVEDIYVKNILNDRVYSSTQALHVQAQAAGQDYQNESEPESIASAISQAGREAAREQKLSANYLTSSANHNWRETVKQTLETRIGKPMPEREHAKPAKQDPIKVRREQTPSNIISLHLMASRSNPFIGRKVKDALLTQHLSLGALDIFHYLDSKGQTLFSVSRAGSPGSFDAAALQTEKLKGLSLFFELDKSSNPKRCFERMLRCADELAHRLGGDVLDYHHQRLTQASIDEYLARIRGARSSQRALV